MKKFILSLLLSTLALPVAAHAEMTAAQKTEIEALVKQYILDHGDVVIDSVNRFQQKKEAEADKDSAVKAKNLLASIKNDKNLAMAGDPNGDVTVVEFFDFNCGYCKKAFPEVQQLLKEDKKVKVVFYDMPILGPDSLESSKWALAAKKQGKYFEYHTALMGHQGQKDAATFKKLATDIGLDADKMEKDKASPEIEAELKKHVELAQSLNIQGTPGFLIDDKIIRGYVPYEAMKATIKSERDTPAKKS